MLSCVVFVACYNYYVYILCCLLSISNACAIPLLCPSGPFKILNSSISPNGIKIGSRSSTVAVLGIIPTNSLMSPVVLC